jgi:hypothetical protein
MRGNKKKRANTENHTYARRNPAMDSICISAMGEQETGTAESIS